MPRWVNGMPEAFPDPRWAEARLRVLALLGERPLPLKALHDRHVRQTPEGALSHEELRLRLRELCSLRYANCAARGVHITVAGLRRRQEAGL